MKSIAIALLLLAFQGTALSRTIAATPADYLGLLTTLVPGDTLALTAGVYESGLTLNGLNGSAAHPIVIAGPVGTGSAIFNGRSCCNTISITKCSYLIIRDVHVDGLGLEVDGVKAEGTAGNWAHHITLENLLLVHHGANQQIVGISTKCHAWAWTIRGCTVIGAGTGLYLGNSNGDAPFVGGLIENNLVINCTGYDMQIKHQLNTVRAAFPGTDVDSQVTIIRYNVWSKAEGASSGADARPAVLLGAFPATGNGTNDHYELYGNFFYNNPVEALLQVTGNTALYANVIVNELAPNGFPAVSIINQNGFAPRGIAVFHNTIVSNASNRGIRLLGADPAYRQHCAGNAVFSASPISGFPAADTTDNVTDSYANAAKYLTAPDAALPGLDAYPKSSTLQGTESDRTPFARFTDFDRDFNGDVYDWRFRGAYSGFGTNPGWRLKLALRDTPGGTTSLSQPVANNFLGTIFPNPSNGCFELQLSLPSPSRVTITLCDIAGRSVALLHDGSLPSGSSTIPGVANGIAPGVYFLRIERFSGGVHSLDLLRLVVLKQV
jgi:hypothetical protein